MKTFRSVLGVALVASVAFVVTASAVDPQQAIRESAYPSNINVVCIGDSITCGVGAGKDPNWVALVGRALGPKWRVQNFGLSGHTLLQHGNAPYMKNPRYQQALAARADVALIALGTNDSKPVNRPFLGEMAADYAAMIADLRKANPDVRIFCCLPIPVYPEQWGISDEVVRTQILPIIRKVASDQHAGLIDLYTPMIGKGAFVPDKVHPNGSGYAVMARSIYRALTGKDATQQQIPDPSYSAAK